MGKTLDLGYNNKLFKCWRISDKKCLRIKGTDSCKWKCPKQLGWIKRINHKRTSEVGTNNMRLSDREQEGVVILEPKGKIMGGPDATLLHDKLHEIIEAGKKQVIIDLSQVDWMNSTGLGILISTLTTLRNNNGELKLANVTEKIQSLLVITKLAPVFDSFDTIDDAIKSFN
jgi:anti-sigma B factor antagonist